MNWCTLLLKLFSVETPPYELWSSLAILIQTAKRIFVIAFLLPLIPVVIVISVHLLTEINIIVFNTLFKAKQQAQFIYSSAHVTAFTWGKLSVGSEIAYATMDQHCKVPIEMLWGSTLHPSTPPLIFLQIRVCCLGGAVSASSCSAARLFDTATFWTIMCMFCMVAYMLIYIYLGWHRHNFIYSFVVRQWTFGLSVFPSSEGVHGVVSPRFYGKLRLPISNMASLFLLVGNV